jgi:hypothetical protein
MQVAVIEGKFIGVVLGSPSLGVDHGERSITGNASR